MPDIVTSPAPRRAAGGSHIKLTHPDRVYWPEGGITKLDLAQLYADVWPLMAPHVAARPLALLRCPDGVAGQCFFQKHPWRGLDRAIAVETDPKAEGDASLLVIRDVDGLLALVQSGALEVHAWGAVIATLERPDRVVIDLDPGEGIVWKDLIEAAREVRQRLEAAGLAAFVKTSGGKGLHVVAPLRPRAGWPALRAFAAALARAMSADSPERYVAKVGREKRTGHILVDYLRNGRGATAVVPYSSRARPGAHVSMPLAWEDLVPDLTPAAFTVASAREHIGRRGGDPWAAFAEAAAPLGKRG